MSLPVFGTISKITGSFGTTFEVTGSYLKAETSFLKRFTGRILRISKWFQRSEPKLFYIFSTKLGAKYCENNQRSLQKVLI
jgi:hypothetical protein